MSLIRSDEDVLVRTHTEPSFSTDSKDVGPAGSQVCCQGPQLPVRSHHHLLGAHPVGVPGEWDQDGEGGAQLWNRTRVGCFQQHPQNFRTSLILWLVIDTVNMVERLAWLLRFVMEDKLQFNMQHVKDRFDRKNVLAASVPPANMLDSGLEMTSDHIFDGANETADYDVPEDEARAASEEFDAFDELAFGRAEHDQSVHGSSRLDLFLAQCCVRDACKEIEVGLENNSKAEYVTKRDAEELWVKVETADDRLDSYADVLGTYYNDLVVHGLASHFEASLLDWSNMVEDSKDDARDIMKRGELTDISEESIEVEEERKFHRWPDIYVTELLSKLPNPTPFTMPVSSPNSNMGPPSFPTCPRLPLTHPQSTVSCTPG